MFLLDLVWQTSYNHIELLIVLLIIKFKYHQVCIHYLTHAQTVIFLYSQNVLEKKNQTRMG